MMSDHDLLELVAKAASIKLAAWNDGDEPYSSGIGFILPSNGMWNPLANDSDALRLAVALGIEFRFRIDQGECVVAEQSKSLASSFRSHPQPVIVNYVPEHMFSSSYAPDRSHADYLTNIRGLERGVAAATRRAIVLAAATLVKEGSESNG